MQAAAEAMAPSADKLKGMQWKDAIPLEQKALQASAAGGGDLPADSGRLRPAGRRWRWRRRQCGPRPGQPVRSGTGHGEEPVRDGADRISRGAARRRMWRCAGEAGCAGQAAGGAGQPAAQSAAELPGALAAGDAAARGGATAAADGADGAEQPGPAGTASSRTGSRAQADSLRDSPGRSRRSPVRSSRARRRRAVAVSEWRSQAKQQQAGQAELRAISGSADRAGTEPAAPGG